MPATVVIENSKTLDNNESLSVIDNLTESLKRVKGVKQVSSVTQPEGLQIDGFYIGSQTKAVTDGLSASQAGLNQIYYGLIKAEGKPGAAGATRSSQMAEGLKKIADGLSMTKGYLSELNTNRTFFISKKALTNLGFKPALDMFMSEDRTITKITVILKDEPYSKEALNTVKLINDTVSNGLEGTVLSNAKFGVSGQSAYTKNMNDILTRDLNKITIIVLIGVFLVLLLVIRSFWTPVFITTSLMGAYYAAMFILNFIFLNVKGLTGISSYIPFFSFIIIVALGVDYSIFLMMRFKEYPHMSPKEAIVLASRHIGGVVMSAGVILGGTFATLMPSGILLLQEWAVAVITGLTVLCFILLPIFLPAMISLQGTIANLLSGRRRHLSSEKKIA
jgi:putative drug exporter of the RND superfamily